MKPYSRGLHILQKISMSLMGVLVLITFVGANLHALLWQSSEWLVSTVLPAVVIDLTNQERADNDAPPLRRNSVLDDAAQLKAKDMSENGYFAHFSPTGVSPWHWFDEAGYVYAHAGENLAIHFTDSTEVVEAWMKSPAHRQNIVNGLYTEIGVGTAKGRYEGYDTVYVVQLFGTPAMTPTPTPTTVATTPEATPTEVVSEEVALTQPSTPPETVAAAETETSFALAEQESFLEPEAATSDSELVVEPAPAAEVIQETPLAAAVAERQEESPSVVESVEPGPIPVKDDVLVIERPLIATSSGLVAANVTTPHSTHSGATAAFIVTQPNTLLQIVYLTLGAIVFLLLGASIVLEARRLHYLQVAYGVLLLFGMSGLWYIHSLLTAGAVIV